MITGINRFGSSSISRFRFGAITKLDRLNCCSPPGNSVPPSPALTRGPSACRARAGFSARPEHSARSASENRSSNVRLPARPGQTLVLPASLLWRRISASPRSPLPLDAAEMPGGKPSKTRRIYVRDASWRANRVTVIAAKSWSRAGQSRVSPSSSNSGSPHPSPFERQCCHGQSYPPRVPLERHGAIAAGALLPLASRGLAAPSDRIRVAVIGCGGRGKDHANTLLDVPAVEVAAFCDPDATRLDEKGDGIRKAHGQKTGSATRTCGACWTTRASTP